MFKEQETQTEDLEKQMHISTTSQRREVLQSQHPLKLEFINECKGTGCFLNQLNFVEPVTNKTALHLYLKEVIGQKLNSKVVKYLIEEGCQFNL